MQVPLSRIASFGLLPASVVFLVATVVIALRDPKHRPRQGP